MALMQRSPGQKGKRLQLPSGFRFRPTDEELVVYMRTRRVHGGHITAGIFHQVKLLDYHPRTLIELFDHEGEKKVYLLSSRSRRYPNGDRPCRSAEGGYWKASGKDRPIENKAGQKIGTKRSLSFHEGHQPNGIKTNWLMQEYKIEESHQLSDPSKGCTTLDDCVLFVVYLNGNKDVKGKNDGKRNTSALEEGTLPTSSEPNKVVKLRTVAAATDNTRKGKSIVVAPCTSYGSHEATTHLKNLAAGCCGALLPPLRARPEGDHTVASHLGAMDALDAGKTEASSSSKPSSFTQSFYYDHLSYYGMQQQGPVGWDYPIPLRATIDQAPLIRCSPGSCGLEPNHQYCQGMKPGAVDHLSYYGMQQGTAGCDYPIPLSATIDQVPLIRCTPGSWGIEHNHQYYQGMQPGAVNCGTNLGMLYPPSCEDLLAMAAQGNVQSQNLGFDGWNNTSMQMGALTSYEPASSAPQHLQYNNYQGDFATQMHNGVSTLQWNGQTHDLPVYGCSSTGLNIGALTRNELALPTPHYLQCGDHQSSLNMQMDNGSNQVDFGGPYTNDNWCSDGMPSSSDEPWDKLSQDPEFGNSMLDPLTEVFLDDILEPNPPDGIGPLDNPPTFQASASVAEVPQPDVVPETTAGPPPCASSNGMEISAKPGIVALVIPDYAANC